MHQGTVLGERAEIEEDMVEFEGMVETEGFRKLTKEAETQGGWRETGGTGGGVDHKKEVVPGNEDLDFRKQISPELDEEETEKLVKDLGRFVDVFAKRKGATGDVQHGRARDPIGSQRETGISVTDIDGIQGTTYSPGADVKD